MANAQPPLSDSISPSLSRFLDPTAGGRRAGDQNSRRQARRREPRPWGQRKHAAAVLGGATCRSRNPHGGSTSRMDASQFLISSTIGMVLAKIHECIPYLICNLSLNIFEFLFVSKEIFSLNSLRLITSWYCRSQLELSRLNCFFLLGDFRFLIHSIFTTAQNLKE